METLDARGLLCPVPVLRARDRLKSLAPGDRLDVLADDPLAPVDLQVFCAREGHLYLGDVEEPGGGRRMTVRKGGAGRGS